MPAKAFPCGEKSGSTEVDIPDMRGKGMVGSPTSRGQDMAGTVRGREAEDMVVSWGREHFLAGAGAAAHSPGILIGAGREHTR